MNGCGQMEGIVIGVNPRKGFVAVDTDHGITVMELLGGYHVECGDIVAGDLESCGDELVRNKSQYEDMDVFVQGVYCTAENARQLMC